MVNDRPKNRVQELGSWAEAVRKAREELRIASIRQAPDLAPVYQGTQTLRRRVGQGQVRRQYLSSGVATKLLLGQ